MNFPTISGMETGGSNLAKNPGGYCPNHATGVKLPDGWAVTPLQYVD